MKKLYSIAAIALIAIAAAFVVSELASSNENSGDT